MEGTSGYLPRVRFGSPTSGDGQYRLVIASDRSPLRQWEAQQCKWIS